jgi:hypothetical protein
MDQPRVGMGRLRSFLMRTPLWALVLIGYAIGDLSITLVRIALRLLENAG